MELFDLPPTPTERLTAPLHKAVFGALPSTLAASLHTPQIGDLVLQLTDSGWRPGQIAARVGAHPAGRDPVAEIEALLCQLLEQVPPDAQWREEKARRAAEGSRGPEPASEASREAWIAQIRSELGTPSPRKVAPVRPLRPACALCEAESTYFVTKQVRLCEGCVVLLATGAVRLAETG
jgi:hypothetical protein